MPETSHVLLCPLAGTAHYMSAALTTYMVADSRDVHPNLEGLRIEWYICTTYRRSDATENDKQVPALLIARTSLRAHLLHLHATLPEVN